jgi:hypothetical protein
LRLRHQKEADRAGIRNAADPAGEDQLDPFPGEADEYEALGADPEFMEMIHDMAQAREQHWANMRKLQEWVRREYAAKGYVEVDEDSVELAASCPRRMLPALTKQITRTRKRVNFRKP